MDLPHGVGPVPWERGPARTPAGGLWSPPSLTDFGRQVVGQPARLYRPETINELAAAVLEAVTQGLPVVPRGLGHSVDGQTTGAGAAVVDMTALDRVLDLQPDAVTVEAGASWRTVVDSTLARGLVPPVVVDYLGLTVGGTLSMGGISGVSHLHGTQADHVLGATVVDPTGAVLGLSRGDPRLDLVLGRQGRHGVLATVRLALVRAPASVRRTEIVTTTLTDHLAIESSVLQSGSASWMDGAVDVGAEEQLEFRTHLAQPDLVGGPPLLGDGTGGIVDFADFLRRSDAAVEAQRESGAWSTHAHPRLQTILPLAPGTEVVSELLGSTTRDLLGPGGRVMLYATRAAPLARLRVRGDAAGLALVVGWQRTAPAKDPEVLRAMQRANDRVWRLAATVGGVPYAAGG